MSSPAAFPIDSLLPEILGSLAVHPRLVLEAPPGAGKTTRVPPALLQAEWLHGRRIVMLEPRRIAARAAAGFMAAALGEPVGQQVGYRIRFESRISADTRIEVLTEGMLTRRLQSDPLLEDVGVLLFDEFHERHLQADLGLALALDIQAEARPELRIVLMSATLDGERLARFLEAPRLVSSGRSFPVSVSHPPAAAGEPESAQLRRALLQALDEVDGDLLVFLPGLREIQRAETLLAPLVEGRASVHLLHGELPVERQAELLATHATDRRIVLATNVAESSVTLPGVRAVIDSGLAREPRFDPNSGFSRLVTVAISQASADQRAGRAGRVAPGICLRLWPQSQRLEPSRRAEIEQVDLCGLLLEIRAWGSDALRFLDPPPPGALAQAEDLLRRLGALDASGRPTASGRRMLEIGTHPRLAAMLLAAADDAERALACDLLALIEARDPLQGDARRRDDWHVRWSALTALRSRRHPVDAHRGALHAIDQAARNWRRRLRVDQPPPDDLPAHCVGDLLLHAFPDRIARQQDNDPLRYQLSNGRVVRLFPDSAVYGERWLVVSELRGEVIVRAAPFDEARLLRDFADRFVEVDEVRFDADSRSIRALRVRRFDQLLLDSRSVGAPDPQRAARALLDGVRSLGLDVLPWSESLRQWQLRVACLRGWCPELGLPDLADSGLMNTLQDWLLPFLHGRTRLAQLDAEALGEALRAGLPYALRQRIDELAPRQLLVPSGMQRALSYQLEQPPSLAVKLQEMFGAADTPRIADGRIPVTLHLLSPAGRPIQITQDLRSFWHNTYPEVRKELKGRYPKHPWPEDPWTAQATHRAKPRR